MSWPITSSRAFSPLRGLLRAAPNKRNAAQAKMTPAAMQAKKKGKSAIGGDTRYPPIKDMLYADMKQPSPPTEEEIDMHNTIEHAWKLHTTEKRRLHMLDLQHKYRRMRDAMVDLETSDPERFRIAMDRDAFDERELYFPRLLKAPTLTPSKSGWNYAYVAASPK
ncbi:hypothetical protein RI367_001194 [Sorochytrium milnesiophthora]